MKRFSIDNSNIIKGVAIIFMIFHHLFRLEEFSVNYSLSFFPFTVKRVAQITTFMKLCVPLFVFISGYGLLYSYKKMKKEKNFFIVRFLKLMPTFWIVAIITCIFLELKTHFFTIYIQNNDIYSGIAYLIFNILGINTIVGGQVPLTIDANWWYMGASLIFIFLVPVIYKCSKKIGWFNVGLAIILTPRILNLSNFSTTTALPFIFLLFLGMYAEDCNILEKIVDFKIVTNNIINKILKLTIYLILLTLCYIYSSHVPRNIFWELHFGFTTLVLIIIIYEFISKIKIVSYILKKLGEYSYIMFLIHGFIYSNFPKLIYNTPHFIISGIYLLVISFIISFLLKNVLNKIGYYKIFKKIENKLK